MTEKHLNTRIIHKHDTEANWNKAVNFIPKQGELIVYDIDENYDYERIKIGDGVTNVNNLSFSAERWIETIAVLRSEIEDEDALQLVTELKLVAPVTSEDDAVYIDENENIYSL